MSISDNSQHLQIGILGKTNCLQETLLLIGERLSSTVDARTIKLDTEDIEKSYCVFLKERVEFSYVEPGASYCFITSCVVLSDLHKS